MQPLKSATKTPRISESKLRFSDDIQVLVNRDLMRNASSYPGFNYKYSKTQNKESFGKTAGCYLPRPAKRGCQGVCITNRSKNGSSKGIGETKASRTDGRSRVGPMRLPYF